MLRPPRAAGARPVCTMAYSASPGESGKSSKVIEGASEHPDVKAGQCMWLMWNICVDGLDRIVNGIMNQ